MPKPVGNAPTMERPIIDLPAPDSPTTPEDATRRQAEGQSPDNLDVSSAEPGADGEIRRCEDGQALLAAPRRTSSVRRNPSPSRLNPVTVRKIAVIGTSNVHGACAKLVRESAII